ncbi:MAG: orotate phosphoribosyltransferase [Euryarchaeota archaeon]|jgi:orotate phosphoribosyltransferase|nr:orotate phosphoribosyltransferase [Euryarchaeota archaeon]MBT3971694.1 orotate phosphoribosyltransferase [Euryarchaeota archaeon]MBT4406341.1 orotate phosphoribosyltransferase [Euryarchaeota archaeon]MBT6645755.1 orotate phosphoribosyltransferase [Euryarchaeota archaeon]
MVVHEPIRKDPRWQRLVELVKELAYMRAEDELFTLASGRQSPHFFDMKPIMMHPEGSKLLGELINERLDSWQPNYVGGLELGAVPLTAIVISTSGTSCPRKGFMVRKQSKGRGGRKTNNPPGVEGTGIMGGGTIVVLEDVTTTGGSSLKAVERLLQETPCEVLGVITILDREEGGVAAFADSNLRFEAIMSLSDIAN